MKALCTVLPIVVQRLLRTGVASRWVMVLAWLASGIGAQVASAWGQPPQAEVSSETGPAVPRRIGPIQQSVLDVFYYRDESGKLVPVVESVTLEELDRYKRSQLNQTARTATPEPYRFLGDIRFVGNVSEELAEVEATFSIQISPPAPSAVLPNSASTSAPPANLPPSNQPAASPSATGNALPKTPPASNPPDTNLPDPSPPATGPASNNPAINQPAAGSPPASAQPASAQPASAQPAGTQPAGTQPASAQPVGGQPATTASPLMTNQTAPDRPMSDQPAASQPAASPSAVWVRVPLRMNRAILIGDLDAAASGSHFISFDRAADGYIAWCNAEQAEHQFRLKLKVPLIREAGKTRFSLISPVGPSRFVLRFTREVVDVESNNEEVNIITTRPLSGGGTELQVENVGGALQLSWRDRKPLPAVLKSVGTIRTTLTGRQVDSEVSLKVQSLGGPLETFDVWLPPELRLLPESRPGLEVTEVETDPLKQRQRIRIARRDGKLSTQLEVKLRALTPASPAVSTGRLELAGFDVVGAVRQAGSVEIVNRGDWVVDWFPGPYVRQVSIGPRADGVTARFEYDRQPYSLQAEVRARESRVQLEPIYLIRVQAHQLQLTATLKYKVSGAQTRELRWQMEPWMVDRVTPGELLDGAPTTDPSQPLVIPLARNGSNADGERQLRIEAHFPLDPTQRSFQVPLPRSLVGGSLPATIVVLADDNVELVPRSDDIKGLVPETVMPVLELPERQQRPILYREELAVDAATFAADLVVRSGSTSILVDTTVRLSESTITVEEEFQCRISYEPISQLKVSAPSALAAPERLQFFLEDRPLSVTAAAPSGDATAARVELAIALPAPRIKPCTIVARYSQPVPTLRTTEPTPLVIELVQPVEDAATVVTENRLRVEVDERVEVDPADELWDMVLDTNTQDDEGPEPLFHFSGSVSRLQLSASLADTSRSSSTFLERVWVQSWIGGDTRLDRCCFRLITNQERVTLQLPDAAKLTDLAVDRQPQPVPTGPQERLVVELGKAVPGQPRTLELWYRLPIATGLFRRWRVEVPKIIEATEPQRTYWQLVLPATQQLLWAPDWLTSESTWVWDRFAFRRSPNRTQEQLERQVGASQQDPPATGATNQYLYSSIGPAATLEYVTLGRAPLTACLSLLALLAGLALLYVPALRHAACLLVVGISLLALGYVYPETAILCGQSAALGVVMVLVARLLQWHESGYRWHRPKYAGSGQALLIDSRLDEPIVLPTDESSQRTTSMAGAGIGIVSETSPN